MSVIVLTGGGTAGHVTPNLALIPMLKKHFDTIIYIGSETGPEKQLVAQFPEVQFYPITTVKLIRSLSPKNLLIPFKLFKGKNQAKQLLLKIKPDVIFSKGGFVSVPVTMAGKSLKIPMLAHESDYTLGLANKLTKNNYNVICTTFKDTAETLKNGLYVGSPFKKPEVTPQEKARIRQQLNLSTTKPICLVMGGSQGATAINDIILKNLDYILRTHQVVHLTGKGKISNIKKEGYHAIEFFSNMPALLSLCDIAITRGGSNAIFELLSFQIPMLIIPLAKSSRGDQVQNAKYFTQKGYALMLLEQNLTNETFKQKFKELIKTAPTMRASTKHAVPNDTLEKICSLIIKYKN